MRSFPDTSFLCALYRTQENSGRAVAYRSTLTEPLPVSRLLLWEFRQSVRFQSYRYSKDRNTGYPALEAEKMLGDLGEDLREGLVVLVEHDIVAILARGEQISKSRTALHGHRGFDIMHVATALELEISEFLTFDTNQTALAKALRLATPLAN